MALSRIKVWVYEKLLATDLNAEFNNLLNNALSLISPLTGNLDAGSNRIIALASATARTDAMNAGQAQDGGFNYALTAGSADAQTVTLAPAITAYATGMEFMIKVGAGLTTTTTTPTLNANGIGAKTLVDSNGSALVFGAALSAGAFQKLAYDGTNLRIMTEPYKVAAWTPVLTAAAGGSYTQTSVGYYKRTGPLVQFSGSITVTAIVSSPSGALTIAGLPYTTFDSDANAAGVALYTDDINIDVASANYTMVARVIKNTTTLGLFAPVDNTTNSGATGLMKSTSVLRFTGHYFTGAVF